MRLGRWRLVFGVLIVLAIGIWDVGLPGHHSSGTSASPSGQVVASPSASASVAVAKIPGVVQPVGTPEFSAAFTGTRLDTSVWATCYPGTVASAGCRNYSNQEYQWYLPSQAQVYEGDLHLVAKRVPADGKTADGLPQTYACRSGMVTSYPGFQFQYGLVEVVARIPSGDGLWSALWLEAADLKWPPEIDMMEAWGFDQFASAYFHPAPRGTAEVREPVSPATRATGWHTFGLSWTATQMTWLLDGKAILTVHDHIPHEKMFLIANLAEYQPVASGTDQCDGELLVRSVKVWKA